MGISAILWDFDGTIIDTLSQHFLVNQKIYSLVKPNEKKDNWPEALTNLDKYIKAEYETVNWRDLYKTFGFSEEQTNQAGGMWTNQVSKNRELMKMFLGIYDILQSIDLPQGICSLNCSDHIKNILQANGIDHHFTSVVGYNDISFDSQKPHPEGFLLCIDKMNIKNSGTIFYIGDHKEDVKFAKNSEIALKNRGDDFSILTIAACYGGSDCSSWDVQPDFVAHNTSDISEIIRKFV